jgi:hypothetical protein
VSNFPLRRVVLRDSDAAAAEREIRVKGVAIMVKRIIVASALALFSVGLAGAGGGLLRRGFLPPSKPARRKCTAWRA